MSRRRRRTVFGEPVELLTDALLTLQLRPSDVPGHVAVEGKMTCAQGGALLRAMMRAESVLLKRDADLVTDDGVVAGPEDRSGRALLLVLDRLNAKDGANARRTRGSAA